MATIGRRAAVAELRRGLQLRGTVAWIAWLGLHLVCLAGFRNRISVFLNWAWNYLTGDRGPRLILDRHAKHPGVRYDMSTREGRGGHMNVGVRELKQQLSSYLRLVADGERIVVTDRGRPAAMLVPLPVVDGVERGIEQGWISPAISSAPRPANPLRYPATATVQQMIDEDRSDE